MGQTARDSSGYQNMGSVSRFPELQSICGAIFSKATHFSLPNGQRVKTKIFKRELFAVEHEGVRYVEQNPQTTSAYAERARAGARIVWVIRTARKINGQWVACNEWLGRIEDGVVWMK